MDTTHKTLVNAMIFSADSSCKNHSIIIEPILYKNDKSRMRSSLTAEKIVVNAVSPELVFGI